MSRHVVAREGEPTKDGRRIEPGALWMRGAAIPVSERGDNFETKLIGKATDLQRGGNDLSLDLSVHLPDGWSPHIEVDEADITYDDDGTMVVRKGRLCGVFISEGEWGWG